jgi:hypothetical protein
LTKMEKKSNEVIGQWACPIWHDSKKGRSMVL